jgi:serine protease
VAGTVAQSTHNGKGVMGVAFDAAIMPIKVLSARGSGTLGDIADGIYFSANHGARVINMSLGGGFAESTLRTAVAKAHGKGVIVVCAAGNSGAGKPGYPAAYDGAVAVSATDFNEDLTFYSNHGPAIDIAAPGGDTRNDKNGDGQPDGVLQNAPTPGQPLKHDYLWFMGTSMACPHVAGVSALVESLGVTQPDAVERLLKSTARDKGPEGRERGYGAGIVDAQRACWKAGIQFGAWRLGLGMLFLALPALAMLRRGYLLGLIFAFPAAVFASSGLFFLPLLLSSNTPHCWMWTTGLPSWGLHLLGAQHHGNPLLFSALLPVILSLLAVDIRPLRSLVAGLSAGWAAHLLFATFTGSVAILFMPGLLGTLWMLGNGLFLIFLASVLGEEQP